MNSNHSQSNTLEIGTGSNLKRIMREKGVSKSELIGKTGIARATFNRITSGDQIGNLATWKTVGDALEVGIDEMFEEE